MSVDKAIQTNNTFDVIVIGSGIGGLTIASLLSQFQHKRCLVLERNFNVGGLTQSFVRHKKYMFDAGVHYIGQMHTGAMPRKLMDAVSMGEVQWNKMPDVFEKFVYPDFTFSTPSNKAEYVQALCDHFPKEKKAIAQYFKDVEQAFRASSLHQFSEALPVRLEWLSKCISKW